MNSLPWIFKLDNYISKFFIRPPPPWIKLPPSTSFYPKEVTMDYLSVFTEMLLARGLADNTVRNYQTYIKTFQKNV